MTPQLLLGSALTLAAIVAVASPVLAQTAPAGLVTAAKGQVTAARVGQPERVPLKFKDDVFLRDRIEAGDESFAKILLGGKALVTVRERSVLTITEVPGRATVEVTRGQAVLSLGRTLLTPGESVEIRTPSAIAAVRGSTVFVCVESCETGQSEVIAAFAVSKPVQVWLLANPGALVELESYQMLSILGPGGAKSFSGITEVSPGLLKYFEQPKAGHIQQLPDQVVEKFQQAAANSNHGDNFPPGLNPARGVGVYENICQNSPTSCATPPPPGPPPGLPPGPPTQDPQSPTPPGVTPPVVSGKPSGPPPPGPPPSPPSSASFQPPGKGGTQPFVQGNLPPGHGGIPPGQRKK